MAETTFNPQPPWSTLTLGRRLRSANDPKADTSLIKRVLVDLAVLHDDLEIVRIKLAAVFPSPLNRNFAEVTAAFLEAERIGQLF